MKTQKEKESLIEQLKRAPIIQIACEKAGVGRATLYRWKNEDPVFAKAVETAINEGKYLINDVAESQLISLLRDKNMTAIMYWLRHHHPEYANRVEVTANLKQIDEKLTPEQEAVVQEALRLASLTPEKQITNHDTKIHE